MPANRECIVSIKCPPVPSSSCENERHGNGSSRLVGVRTTTPTVDGAHPTVKQTRSQASKSILGGKTSQNMQVRVSIVATTFGCVHGQPLGWMHIVTALDECSFCHAWKAFTVIRVQYERPPSTQVSRESAIMMMAEFEHPHVYLCAKR